MGKSQEKTAVFINLVEGEELDLECVLAQARDQGILEEARCYGDFSQQKLACLAPDLYAWGVTMVHSPTWKADAGNFTCGSDRLLEKDVADTITRRRAISTYFLVTPNLDIVPTCHSIAEQRSRFVVFTYRDEPLAGMLRSCGFDIRVAPRRIREVEQEVIAQECPRSPGDCQHDLTTHCEDSLHGCIAGRADPLNRELWLSVFRRATGWVATSLRIRARQVW